MGGQWPASSVIWIAAVFLARSGLLASDVGMTLEVAVLEVGDSRPIPGAELIVERMSGTPASVAVDSEDVDGRIITRAESNERGQIVLRELPKVPMRLTLKADGYVAPGIPALDGRLPTRKLELRLPRAIEITGSVVDDAGAPVPNVAVGVESTVLDREGRVFLAADSFLARTDATGTFRIPRVPEGTGRFTVSASGFTLFEDGAFRNLGQAPITLKVGRTGVLRVDLQAPLHKRGQYWITVESENAQGGRVKKFEQAGADRGAIIFSDVAPGRYKISAAIRSTRNPEPPLTATAEVGVARATDVRLGPMK
jgi:hypothetical protein